MSSVDKELEKDLLAAIPINDHRERGGTNILPKKGLWKTCGNNQCVRKEKCLRHMQYLVDVCSGTVARYSNYTGSLVLRRTGECRNCSRFISFEQERKLWSGNKGG